MGLRRIVSYSLGASVPYVIVRSDVSCSASRAQLYPRFANSLMQHYSTPASYPRQRAGRVDKHAGGGTGPDTGLQRRYGGRVGGRDATGLPGYDSVADDGGGGREAAAVGGVRSRGGAVSACFFTYGDTSAVLDADSRGYNTDRWEISR